MDAVEHPAKKSIIQDLWLNAVVLGLCLVFQLAVLLTQGPSHAAWQTYVEVLAGLLGVALVSHALACRDRIFYAMNLYAWSGMAAIVATTIVSMKPGNDLPATVTLIVSVGAAWLYSALNWPSVLAYAIGALVAFTGLGIAYNQLDDVVPAIVLLLISTRVGARLWHSNRLSAAVEIKTNGGRTAPGV